MTIDELERQMQSLIENRKDLLKQTRVQRRHIDQSIARVAHKEGILQHELKVMASLKQLYQELGREAVALRGRITAKRAGQPEEGSE
ncbi:MAG: hypothetical protein OER56_08305 [Hyphomicrobiales bacterium]|nr:hypothetical protein [Hyphomicrobiales bacterium]